MYTVRGTRERGAAESEKATTSTELLGITLRKAHREAVLRKFERKGEDR